MFCLSSWATGARAVSIDEPASPIPNVCVHTVSSRSKRFKHFALAQGSVTKFSIDSDTMPRGPSHFTGEPSVTVVLVVWLVFPRQTSRSVLGRTKVRGLKTPRTFRTFVHRMDEKYEMGFVPLRSFRTLVGWVLQMQTAWGADDVAGAHQSTQCIAGGVLSHAEVAAGLADGRLVP